MIMIDMQKEREKILAELKQVKFTAVSSLEDGDFDERELALILKDFFSEEEIQE